MDFKNVNTQTIGILGGYGPYATHFFFKLILDNTVAQKDWEHHHIIIENNPRIPSRARAYLFNEESPFPYMLESISRLKNAGASFFACPCNTAHFFLRQYKLDTDFELPFVDMVDCTVEQIVKDKRRKVGLIGSEVTVQAKLYEAPLKSKEIELVNIEYLEEARSIIEAGKTNTNILEAKNKLNLLFKELIDKGAEAIIYGCTELPLVIPIDETDVTIYDTSLILAKKCIELANQKDLS